MIKTEFKEQGHTTVQTFICDDIEEAIERIVPHIRPQSKNFYKKELREELQRDGESIVDHHAIGMHTKVYYQPKIEQNKNQTLLFK